MSRLAERRGGSGRWQFHSCSTSHHHRDVCCQNFAFQSWLLRREVDSVLAELWDSLEQRAQKGGFVVGSAH